MNAAERAYRALRSNNKVERHSVFGFRKAQSSRQPLIGEIGVEDVEPVISLSAFGLDEGDYEEGWDPRSLTTAANATLVAPLGAGLIRGLNFDEGFLRKTNATAFHDRIMFVDLDEKVARLIDQDGFSIRSDLEALACLQLYLENVRSLAGSVIDFSILEGDWDRNIDRLTFRTDDDGCACMSVDVKITTTGHLL